MIALVVVVALYVAAATFLVSFLQGASEES